MKNMTLRAVSFGSGFPLVFLHGFPLDSRMWESQIAELSSKYKVIAPDIPGFGNSQPVHPTTIEKFAGGVCELLDDMNIQEAAICGASMGGYVAFELWRTYKQKIKALILADTRAEADSPTAKHNRERQISLIRSGKKSDVVKLLTENLVSDHTKRSSPEIFEKIARIGSDASPDSLIRTLEALAGRRDSTELLAGINVPTLLIAGENDALIPPAVAISMREKITGSELSIIPQAGHLPPMETPDMFNNIINTFLDKTL